MQERLVAVALQPCKFASRDRRGHVSIRTQAIRRGKGRTLGSVLERVESSPDQLQALQVRQVVSGDDEALHQPAGRGKPKKKVASTSGTESEGPARAKGEHETDVGWSVWAACSDDASHVTTMTPTSRKAAMINLSSTSPPSSPKRRYPEKASARLIASLLLPAFQLLGGRRADAQGQRGQCLTVVSSWPAICQPDRSAHEAKLAAKKLMASSVRT